MAHIQRRCPKCACAVKARACPRCGGAKFSYRVRYIDDSGREKSKTFKLRGDAERFEVGVSHQLLAGLYIDPAISRISLRAQAESWRVNQAHLRPGSASSLEQGFRVHVYPFLGDRPMSSIRPSDIAAWQRGRLKPVGPLGPATLKRIRGQLSAMFKAAIADRVVMVNPVAGVRSPRIVRSEIVPLTVEQVRKLEANLVVGARGGKGVDRYQVIVPLICGSGLRASEALGLTVDRIDFLRRQLRVNRQLVGREPAGAPIFGPPKTDKSTRTIPLADITIVALSEHLRKYPPGPYGLVFTTHRGQAVTREMLGRAWRPAAASIGLEPGDGIHQLRHFYASMLINAGRSVKEVQARLGHASAVETLDTYSHLWPDSYDGTRAAVEAMLA